MILQKDISLKKFNTFHIDASAAYFATFQSTEELKELLELKKELPSLILGGGSNILLSQDFEGLVLKNEIKGVEIINETEEEIYIKAGAGENWHELVMYCVKHNYGGMENLSLIPGNAGASPMQNIGAYGVEIKDIFYELEALDLVDKTVKKFNIEECEFGYRESVFKNKYKGRFIILNVTFRLSKKPVFNISYGAIKDALKEMGVEELSIKAISEAVIRIRKSKLPDPDEIGNAGSFFKNPEIDKEAYERLKLRYAELPGFMISENKYKIPAAYLIEQCGWKGYREGDAGCHLNQPLVIVNYGDASGNEILKLADKIINTVYQEFGIVLNKEVNII